MSRLAATSFLCFVITASWCQPHQVSLGIFTGITAPYTWDEGINSDSRYKSRYEVKFAPIGVAYGVDYQGFGFVVNPSIIRIGQNFHVLNSVGGQEGVRKIDLTYAQIPIGLKLHVIDLAFFKVSLVAGAGIGYLVNGKEAVTHNSAKYRFPAAVYPILPADYTVEYDGVLAPKVEKLEIAGSKDFNPLQFFGSFGFRSDWDVNEVWRVSFDVRANYGFNEPRNSSYLQSIANNQQLYSMDGKRRDMFAYLNLGVARYIEVDKQKNRKTRSGKFIPHDTPQRVTPKRRKF